jgi:hypothetical protein
MPLIRERTLSAPDGGIPRPINLPIGPAARAGPAARTVSTPAGSVELDAMLARNSTMQKRFGRVRRHGAPPEWASVVIAAHFKRVMNFTDPELRKCYEAGVAEASSCPTELRSISALIAAHDTFEMLEGPHSARVHEAIQHLLLPRSRGALRLWYKRAGASDKPSELRMHLSQLAGESL